MSEGRVVADGGVREVMGLGVYKRFSDMKEREKGDEGKDGGQDLILKMNDLNDLNDSDSMNENAMVRHPTKSKISNYLSTHKNQIPKSINSISKNSISKLSKKNTNHQISKTSKTSNKISLQKKGKLISTQTRFTGLVGISSYIYYFSKSTLISFITIIFLYLFITLLSTFST